MIISVKRSGGFAGTTEDLGTVNTERLSPRKAAKIKKLVKGMGLAELAAAGGEEGFDLMQYEITVEDGGEPQTVYVQSGGTPQNEHLRQLLDLVAQQR